jgi:putative tryptophan/tyrosine transport system substrate-binding protein
MLSPDLGRRMQFDQLKRRELLTLIGATVAWPFAARAQQPLVPVVGFLYGATQGPIEHRLRAFRQGLNESGFVEGENVAIVYRFAENRTDRLPELAGELIHRPVNVIAAMSTVAAVSAKAATSTVPIVFVAAEDPVRLGLAASLARPGGNATGINFFTSELTAKRLELLRALVPTASRVAVLVDPNSAAITESTLRDVEPSARAMGLDIQVVRAGTSRDIDAAFASDMRERHALFVSPSGFFTSRRIQIVNQAIRHGMPATYSQREFPDIGGLMSYGTDIAQAWHQAGAYVGRVLKGTKPADLPVVQASKFELVLNHQTARTLGLTVPPSLLAIADEVIE